MKGDNGQIVNALKEHDTITITGWISKDGCNRIAGRQVTLPDGQKLFLGPPAR
ncbi:MAG: hypothetical protein WBE37_23675 [Bryobacteraceae bacterium]